MPQGTVKASTASSTTASKKHSSKQKQKSTQKYKSAVQKSKKNSKAAARQEFTRKGAAGLTRMLEEKLAARAGHTELVSKDAKKRALQGEEVKHKKREKRSG